MTEITGMDVIRNALTANAKKYNISRLARDLGISTAELESFSANRLKLQPEVMKALARELWGGNVEYDAAANLLRPAKRQEPRSLGIAPAPAKPGPQFTAGPPSRGPQPVKPGPRTVKIPRPGWGE